MGIIRELAVALEVAAYSRVLRQISNARSRTAHLRAITQDEQWYNYLSQWYEAYQYVEQILREAIKDAKKEDRW